MKTISIQEVLSQISDDEGIQRTFELVFVRSTGELRGQVKTIEKAQYGYPRNELARRNQGKRGPSQKKRRLHIDAGTIPITDKSTARYVTPKISHIIGFEGMAVKH